MRITSIPQIYRHVNRWREILTVLSKYGLADWISRLDIEFAPNINHPLVSGIEVRRVLSERE